MKTSERTLSGMLFSAKDRTHKTLVVSLPINELVGYFSVDNLIPELKWAFDSAVNSKNIERVSAIQADIEKTVISNVAGAPLSLTFAVVGQPDLSSATRQLPLLTYDASDTYIVGSVLTLVAVCKMLGLKTLLFSSRLSIKEANRKSELRQRLSMEEIEVRIVFDDERGLSPEHVVDLFKKSSLYDAALHLPHIKEGQNVLPEDVFPLKPFIEQLRRETNLDSYGGVSVESKHVKVSEPYITTQYILFKMVVGAVAGVGTQAYSKMSKDVKLADGASVASVLSDGYLDYISVMLRAWLAPLEHRFVHNRSGYHLSPQVWLALGLVIHQLVKDGASVEMLAEAGKTLGELDYRKSASHWRNCQVMELDAKGRVYKNAANSTRQFRIGLADYFLQLVGNKANNKGVN
ncbi:hypothetical protein L4D76_13660 [Photobacterium sagamiensis]|uniref:hypothetical protein n=1 Tax=Photobacterium sagamiensis TaxID=2910241 RepID=UPI003D12A545